MPTRYLAGTGAVVDHVVDFLFVVADGMKHRALKRDMRSAAGAHYRPKGRVVLTGRVPPSEAAFIFFADAYHSSSPWIILLGNGLKISLNQVLVLMLCSCFFFFGGDDGYNRMRVIRRATKDTGERENNIKVPSPL